MENKQIQRPAHYDSALVIVVSHAPALIDALQQLPDCHSSPSK